jgi:hypothetical protein
MVSNLINMNATTVTGTGSTLGELANFLSVFNKKENRMSFPGNRQVNVNVLAAHLERQLPQKTEPAIFRRLGRHTQLVLQFGN